MVRTGGRAARLASLLTAAGLKLDTVPRRAPRLEEFDESAVARVLGVYRALGGVLKHPVLRPGSWDLSFDGIVVELDEELHFNRYRALTLQEHWTRTLPWAASYIEFSRLEENRCLKAGKWGSRWTSASSSRMFGSPALPGDLTDSGSPRWKQRALYDAMKDVVAATDEDFKVARVSVYDRVADLDLGDVLHGRGVPDLDALLTLVSSRAL